MQVPRCVTAWVGVCVCDDCGGLWLPPTLVEKAGQQSPCASSVLKLALELGLLPGSCNPCGM